MNGYAIKIILRKISPTLLPIQKMKEEQGIYKLQVKKIKIIICNIFLVPVVQIVFLHLIEWILSLQIIQYYVNGFPSGANAGRDLSAYRAGGSYQFSGNQIIIDGNSYRLPNGWTDRQDAYEIIQQNVN